MRKEPSKRKSSKSNKKSLTQSAKDLARPFSTVKQSAAAIAASSRKYICPICNRKYPKAQALGGHMSKAHPHMSGQYQYKQQRRNERIDDRKLLKAAKKEYFKLYGAGPIIYRNKLNHIKFRLKEDQGWKDELEVPSPNGKDAAKSAEIC